MKKILLSFWLLAPVAGLVSAAALPPITHHPGAVNYQAKAVKVYVCGGGSAYAYHSSDNCAGLNRCSHGVRAVTVAEAEGMGRRPCKKCY